jgi:stage II sporulation protein D
MQTRIATFAAAALAALTLAVPASASTRFTIRGAGFGHGVGMSQYGAYGFAQHGWAYGDILAHYYTDTQLGKASGSEVRVLMQAVAVARFTGADQAGGRKLNPASTYGVRRGRVAGTVDLISPRGRRLKRVAAPLRVSGPGPVTLRGRTIDGTLNGAYRGALEFRPSGFQGLAVINAVGLEDYVRGVVSRESPSGWPAEALKAQAVAARTYAITTSKGGDGYDQYPDTRSQVYGGVSAETPATDAAVGATAGQVVTYQGQPVVTYFFSTSGGRTEDVENTPLGDLPKPWLKSVDDPYDDTSPRHRWGPMKTSLKHTGARLRGLVKGSFRGIQVVRRGRSPRIVEADVVGSRGTTRVTGATLRARLGLYDTWAYFTTIKTGQQPTPPPDPAAAPEPSPTGGATPEARAARLMARRLSGYVIPARRRSRVRIELRQRHRWISVGAAQTDRFGRYAYAVERPGTYRVRFQGAAGTLVRVR